MHAVLILDGSFRGVTNNVKSDCNAITFPSDKLNHLLIAESDNNTAFIGNTFGKRDKPRDLVVKLQIVSTFDGNISDILV